MHRYVLKFTKEGYFKYTSHLDLLRFFKRSLKRAGIRLAFSEGFNPHPKMGFAQPLSLGYESEYEILEFETREKEDINKMLKALNEFMPTGLDISELVEYVENGKSLAALLSSSAYEIEIPIRDNAAAVLKKAEQFTKEDEILALKKRKKGREKVFEEINIAQRIRKIGFAQCNDNLIIDTLLDAGTDSNLSPELVISSFLKYAGLDVPRDLISVKRKKMYFGNGFEI